MQEKVKGKNNYRPEASIASSILRLGNCCPANAENKKPA
jgi:hypothetical protein